MEHDPDFGRENHGKPIALLQVEPHSQLPHFRLAPTNRAPEASLGTQRAYLDPQLAKQLEGNRLCSAAGILSVFYQESAETFLERKSVLFWINQGVIVDREPLGLRAGSFAVGVVVSSQGLETDISGLIPRHTDEYHRRRELALKLVSKKLRKLQAELGREGVTTAPSAGLATALGGAGLLTLFKLPVISIGLFAMALINYHERAEATQSMDARLDQDFALLVNELEGYAELTGQKSRRSQP